MATALIEDVLMGVDNVKDTRPPAVTTWRREFPRVRVATSPRLINTGRCFRRQR
jgi:hypothetical protein